MYLVTFHHCNKTRCWFVEDTVCLIDGVIICPYICEDDVVLSFRIIMLI